MSTPWPSEGTALRVTLGNGTGVTEVWGLPYSEGRLCGFLEQDAAIGPQLCCTVASSSGIIEGGGARERSPLSAVCEYTSGQRIGQTMDVLTSFFSAIAVSGLLLFALYRRVRQHAQTKGHAVRPETEAIDSSLFLNLMVADLIHAIGNILSIKWIHEGVIGPGDSVCTAQATLKQIGIVLTSVTSLAISVQTFYVLVLRWPIRKAHSRWIVLGLWAFVALDVGIPNAVYRKAEPPYYGSTGYWCWVDPEYQVEQIVTEYLWMWAAAFFMIVLYGIMFAVIFGLINIRRRSTVVTPRSTQLATLQADPSEPDDEREDTEALARMMLLYPAVFVLCIVPISVARWMQFTGHKTPYQATLFGASMFGLSGMLNVVLFWVTRPELVTGPRQPVNISNLGTLVRSGAMAPLEDKTETQERGLSTVLGTRADIKRADSVESFGRLPM